jgi:hypothetical protein
MENKNSPLLRFVIIFVFLMVAFGFLAYYRSDKLDWWGAIFFSLLLAIRLNRIFSTQKIKEPRKPRKVSRHKQYDENRYSNKDMERIYKAYNIQKEDEPEETEAYENQTIEDENQTTNWLLTPTGLPIALSILWFFISI